MSGKNGTKVSISCGGCLVLVVSVIIAWALIFGVTWEGRHHGLTCSTEQGVSIE